MENFFTFSLLYLNTTLARFSFYSNVNALIFPFSQTSSFRYTTVYN